MWLVFVLLNSVLWLCFFSLIWYDVVLCVLVSVSVSVVLSSLIVCV